MARLRATPPHKIAGVEVGVLDLAGRTDALIFTGPGLRVAIRPSGTEPKVKGYIEIRDGGRPMTSPAPATTHNG